MVRRCLHAFEELALLCPSASSSCKKDTLLPSVINPSSVPMYNGVWVSALFCRGCCNKKKASEWEKEMLAWEGAGQNWECRIVLLFLGE